MAGAFIHKIVNGYKIIDFIGAGGMGEVYRAVHTHTGKVVAVKILVVEKFLDRFLNEAKVHSQLKHDNITAMYQLTKIEGKPCIIMEYVEGDDLDKILKRRGKLDIFEAMNIFRELVSAILYLHNKGIIHRDLKPGNIRVKKDGTVKLMDFGIAKDPLTPKLTMVGFAVGTMEYMAPEQLRGTPVKASDIWSLGVLLFEMITGNIPFAAQNTEELKTKILKAKLPASFKDIKHQNKEVANIIKKCLVKDPDKRISDSQLLKITEDFFKKNNDKNTSQDAAGDRDSFINFTAISNAIGGTIKNYGKSILQIAAAIILLILAFVAISNFFHKENTNGVAAGNNTDSLIINVVNVQDAKIELENGKEYALPFVLKKPEDKEVTFTLKAPGYRSKKITLGAVHTRKSFDYVLEKEK